MKTIAKIKALPQARVLDRREAKKEVFLGGCYTTCVRFGWLGCNDADYYKDDPQGRYDCLHDVTAGCWEAC